MKWGPPPKQVTWSAEPGNPLRWGQFSSCECMRWGGGLTGKRFIRVSVHFFWFPPKLELPWTWQETSDTSLTNFFARLISQNTENVYAKKEELHKTSDSRVGCEINLNFARRNHNIPCHDQSRLFAKKRKWKHVYAQLYFLMRINRAWIRKLSMKMLLRPYESVNQTSLHSNYIGSIVKKFIHNTQF